MPVYRDTIAKQKCAQPHRTQICMHRCEATIERGVADERFVCRQVAIASQEPNVCSV